MQQKSANQKSGRAWILDVGVIVVNISIVIIINDFNATNTEPIISYNLNFGFIYFHFIFDSSLIDSFDFKTFDSKAYPIDLLFPNGCLDAYEVKVNKDTFKYQVKAK